MTVVLDVVAAADEVDLAARLEPLVATAQRSRRRLRWDLLAELNLPAVFGAALDAARRRACR